MSPWTRIHDKEFIGELRFLEGVGNVESLTCRHTRREFPNPATVFMMLGCHWSGAYFVGSLEDFYIVVLRRESQNAYWRPTMPCTGQEFVSLKRSTLCFMEDIYVRTTATLGPSNPATGEVDGQTIIMCAHNATKFLMDYQGLQYACESSDMWLPRRY